MSSSSSCVEWSWQRAQGRPSRTPSSAASGRWPADSSNRSPGSRVRSSPASSGRPGHCSDRRSGMARRCAEGRGGRRASSVAGSPSSQSARRWSSRSRLRRRPIAARGCAGLRPYQTRPGKTLPSRSSKASCRPPAGWRRLPPAGSARASGPAPGPGRESAGAGRPTPGSVRDRRRGGLGDVQARLQSVADIVATATCETSLEIQFGAAGERQVEVRTVHSACHSSCR